MEEKEFNDIISSVLDEDNVYIDTQKVKKLDDITKLKCIKFLIENDWIILDEFVPENFDMSVLIKIGYVYNLSKPNGNHFLCKKEHMPKTDP